MARIITICVLIFLCISKTVQAQNEKPNYSLLWEISGNGLNAPSYLFGTMHLRDARVFEFSDSVMAKLDRSKVFAMEVTPDSMVSEIFKSVNKKNLTKDINQYLTAEELKILDKKLYQKTNKKLKDLTRKDPESIYNLLIDHKNHVNDNPTFLDAYLYRIAKEKGKVVVGLEEVKDQIDLVSGQSIHLTQIKEIIYASKGTGKNLEEEFVEAYRQGNLKYFEKYFQSQDSAFVKKLLDDRNIKMFQKANEQMATNSVFIAVGAGHLPGTKGLIQMFKDSGFVVSQVPASFNQKETFRKSLSKSQSDWKTFKSDENNYSVSMPGLPEPVEDPLGRLNGQKTYVYPDLSTGLMYFTLSMPLNTNDSLEIDKVLREIPKKMGKSNPTVKKLFYKGMAGIETEAFQTSDISMKARIISNKKRVYILMAGAYEKNLLSGTEVDQFFNSLEVFPEKPSVWSRQNNVSGGYSIETPALLKDQVINIESESGLIEGRLSSANSDNKIFYFSAYYQLPAGTYIQNDSIYLITSIEGIKDKGKAEIVSIEKEIVNGHESRKYSMKGKDGLSYKGRFLIRGSRPYNIFVIYSEKDSSDSSIDKFLSSFRFEPLMNPEWKSFSDPQNNFRMQVPEGKMSLDSVEGSGINMDKNYIFQDENSGTSYMISVAHFSQFSYLKEDEFYKNLKDEYVQEEDSLLSEKTFTVKGIKGKSFIIQNKDYKTIKRIDIIPKNNSVILFFSFMLKEAKSLKESEKFFNSFEFTGAEPKVSLWTNKTDPMLKALLSKDTVLNEHARTALYSYEFEPQELNKIYTALEKSYGDDTSSEGTRHLLLNKLSSFPATSGLLDFLDSFYKKEKLEEIRISVLKTILNLKTPEALTLFKKFTSGQELAFSKEIPEDFLSSFTDSLEWGEKNFQSVFYLSQNEQFRPHVLETASLLLRSQSLDSIWASNQIENLIPLIKKDFNKYLTSIKKDVLAPYRNVSAAVEFLSLLPGIDASNIYLKDVSKLDNMELSFNASMALIQQKIVPEPTILEKIAADNYYRSYLYEGLKKAKIEKQFPVKWSKQKYFAESDFIRYLMSEDMYPDKIEVIQSMQTLYEGVNSKFYLIKFQSGEDWYAGVSGPFSVQENSISTSGSGTSSLFETYGSKSPKEHFASMLQE